MDSKLETIACGEKAFQIHQDVLILKKRMDFLRGDGETFEDNPRLRVLQNSRI